MRQLLMTTVKACLFAGVAVLATNLSVRAEPAETIVIKNGELHLAGSSNNPTRMERGTIIIENGRIRSVGPEATYPDGAMVIDAEGLPVTPGLFAPISALGIEEISLNGDGNDRRADGDFQLSASLRASDAINADSSVIPITRAGGVTRAYVTPDPGGKLFGGCGAVIDLSGSADPVTRDCLAMATAMGYGGARRTGDTKTGLMAMMRYYLAEALAYDADPKGYRRTVQSTDLSLPDIAALVPYAKGDKPFLMTVSSAGDIRRMLKLAADYDLDLVLVGAEEGWRVADEIAAANVPVILFPLANLPDSFESMAATLENAKRLNEAGVTIALYDNDIGYTHNLRLLPQLAGNAVANGLPYEAALAAISLNPAKIWGLDAELGTLQAGKIADIVIWDGDPLELSTRPLTVIINGEVMSLENRQSLLAERYKDLSRGNRPKAYGD
ncbi:MAG: amidohydrolase family protein [bacterium]